MTFLDFSGLYLVERARERNKSARMLAGGGGGWVGFLMRSLTALTLLCKKVTTVNLRSVAFLASSEARSISKPDWRHWWEPAEKSAPFHIWLSNSLTTRFIPGLRGGEYSL